MGGFVTKAPSKKDDKTPEDKKEALASSGSSKRRRSEKESLASAIGDTINGWIEEDSKMPEDEPYSMERIPLGEIRLDPDNHRTRHINEFNPTEITLPEDHPDYAETVDLIEGLKVFAEHLKKEPLQQEIKVYKHKNRYWIGPGARRWLSCKIAFGDKALIDARAYESKPRNLATSRFVENNQREDTSLYVRVLDFRKAEEEQRQAGITLAKDIAVHLGISTPVYSRLSRVSNDDIVMEHFIANRRITNLKVAALLVGCSSLEEAEEKFKKLSLRGEYSTSKTATSTRRDPRGRRAQSVKVKPIKDLRVAKAFVEGDLFKEVEWTEDDFSSVELFQEKLDACIDKFTKKIARGA